MSDAFRLRTIGFLILAAFPLFGIGQALSTGQNMPWLGLAMCLANSAGVIAIGLLLHPIMARTALRSARNYRMARVAEGVLLAASMIIAVFGRPNAFMVDASYQAGMIALGVGSIGMCWWLIRQAVVPTGLGWLGLVGYLCLVGAMIALAGGAEGFSMVLLLPGTAFEVVFGLMLLLRPRLLAMRVAPGKGQVSAQAQAGFFSAPGPAGG